MQNIARSLIVMADDLSGAAETAAAIFLRNSSNNCAEEAVIRLLPGAALAARPATGNGTRVMVFDLDSRHLDSIAARSRQNSALRLAALEPGSIIFKKIDSLLRGNLAAELGVLAERGPVFLTPCLPQHGRTVRGGVLYLDGVALHQTDAWRAEALQAPTSIAGALKGVATASLPLAKIRGASARAAAAAAIQQARIVICDAETPADLTCIAALALSLGANLAGASALAKALAHRLRDRVPTIPVDATVSLAYPERPLLFIVGTAAIMARRQLDRLAAEGVRLLEVDPASGRIEGQAPEMVILAALAQGPVALSFPADAEVLPGAGRNAVRHLATMAAGVIGELDRPPNLFLSGGETARAVLDALGIDSLVPIEEIDHGAVCCEAPSGQRIITRPGSFGDENGLVRVLHRLKPASSLSQHLSKVHQEASKP